ncbi:MAG: hypothetical protein ACP5JL_03310 [bacterium]|jgi:predicted GH43/DUF377 family glycosyl hydrolase
MGNYLSRYKLGIPVLAPTKNDRDFDSKEVDCANVIMKDGMFYMAYVGWDGTVNRIGLAKSKDLIHWERIGLILDIGDEKDWDSGSVSGPYIYQENGLYYLFYVGFPKIGYENGTGAIGLAISKDILHWDKIPSNPILKSIPGGSWEKGGLYKPCVIEFDELYYLFYNAKDREESFWHERIGVAFSKDLFHWEKYEKNPVLDNGPDLSWDSRFVGDPYIVRIDDIWHMFYYGFDGNKAQEGVAISRDLINWEKSEFNPIIKVGKDGDIDMKYAHKPCVISFNGIWYHFYTAVSKSGERVITLATSEPLDNEK